jgi:hypothetical protein
MSLASDLMGLGSSPLLAAHTASGGNGPINISAAGTNFSTATRIQATQYFVTCSTAGGSGASALALPTIGGDTGALIADDFIVNNATASNSLWVWGSTGVLISIGGSNTSYAILPVHTTATFYVVSATQWVGVKGS